MFVERQVKVSALSSYWSGGTLVLLACSPGDVPFVQLLCHSLFTLEIANILSERYFIKKLKRKT